MLGLASIEEVCEAKRITLTLVLHPALRRAVRPYGESFYVGACCFLRGETNGLYFLPLDSGGYVRLRFSKRKAAAWGWLELGGVVSGVLNPVESGVGAPGGRPRHDERYHE